ncbi:MAG: hypothetical protein EB023_13440, partial [Flavobacteriia bacterium]|nr:hypothetical protein [Flavobacteriia bacterium]
QRKKTVAGNPQRKRFLTPYQTKLSIFRFAGGAAEIFDEGAGLGLGFVGSPGPDFCVTFLCKAGGKFRAFQITPEHLGYTNKRVSR